MNWGLVPMVLAVAALGLRDDLVERGEVGERIATSAVAARRQGR
jgi:hypothetical protein